MVLFFISRIMIVFKRCILFGYAQTQKVNSKILLTSTLLMKMLYIEIVEQTKRMNMIFLH